MTHNAKLLPDKKAITALLALPKPGIVALSLVACFTGLYIGAHGMPPTELLLWTMLGFGMATAAGTTLNSFVDRDIDSKMKRTQGRPLPSGSVSANRAYLIGSALVVVSLLILKVFVNDLAAILSGIAIFTYVVLYTILLKRRTPYATHIGGIAGALPPMVGYAAVTGTLDIKAFILFLVIVVWQQPHFWTLALKYREDYAAAGIPILPVAKGVWATKVRIFWYTLVLYPVSLLPYTVGISGGYFLLTGIFLNLVCIYFTVRFVISAKDKERFLFFFSIFYLTVLFGAMLLDIV
ncbi:MAG: heme o synthase [Nitrospinota bacterium]